MNIKVIVIGIVLGLILHYTIVALALLIGCLMDKLFSKTRKTKEQK